jgi:hypothetical protein
LNVPLVVFMGGGYAKPIDASLDAFEDLFSDAAQWNQRIRTQGYPSNSWVLQGEPMQ